MTPTLNLATTNPASRIRRFSRRGFTLIELLVVVVIIGILASVATPSFVAAQDKARNASAVGNLKVMQLGFEQYATDHNGSMPGNADLLTANGLGANNYLPGNQLPKSPWSSARQTIRLQAPAFPLMCAEWIDAPPLGVYPKPGQKFSPPLPGSVGNPPSLATHYGALTTDTEDVTDRTRYVCNVTGKSGNQITAAGWVTNAGR